MIPFRCIERVLSEFKADIDAIILSLPVDPVMVRSPELLRILTGIRAGEIISHELARIWVAFVFYFRTIGISKDVFEDMQSEQQAAYGDLNTFTLAYLNAYERALVKSIFLQGGGDPGKINLVV